jgi:hypothetical protein
MQEKVVSITGMLSPTIKPLGSVLFSFKFFHLTGNIKYLVVLVGVLVV